MRISVIIPALNEEVGIAACIRRLTGACEVLVADGGSSDATVREASLAGARVIGAQRGRGIQMHAAALESQGDALFFLHADTLAPTAALEQIAGALGNPAVCAGNFNLRFSGPGVPARFLSRVYPSLRRLGLCYGDSGLFVRRETYFAAGGFRPFPVFEDLDLIRRLRHEGRFVHLPATLETSSRRFERGFFPAMLARWTTLQALYWAGVPPRRLARFYAPSTDRTTSS